MASATPLESSHFAGDGTLTLHFDCPGCHEVTEVKGIDPDRYMTWRSGRGPTIGGAFPELDETQREALMTGYHGPCWDALWEGMDDE